ncbi:hypothetical protein QFX18_08965 [Saccharophagus degradans]|uniref:hypothetical protein n=1 Tax=Saccharophagus degradans TaxID=86304 RepID=UPI00247812DA|nr:hypothetical protein [Saccharophagus degradans]WGP00179.1 hypothetical protein QFX18_08965 [Saccharophagus degradans]
MMEVIFKKTEGDYLEAVIEINGQDITVMDEFGGNKYSAGDCIGVELSVGLAYEDEEQATNNQDRQ